MDCRFDLKTHDSLRFADQHGIDGFRPAPDVRASMYEVEVKVRAEHGPVRDRLRERGATFLGRVRQVDTYYDHPGRSFVETDEALRVRREVPAEGDPVTRLTYKGPLVESASKTREEVETRVGDADALDRILQELGFDPVPAVRKDRERFALAGYTVTLDSVDGAGSFVEVERESSDEEIEELRDGARDLLRTLDLDPDEHVRTSYLELVLDSTGDGS
jgi:adenylate cyclase class 2